MKALSIAFSLFMAAVLQAVIPVSGWLGQARLPIMLGVVIYYSLVYRLSWIVVVAVLAGLVEDSLSFAPLGYTAFVYAAGGALIEHYRDLMLTRQVVTHVVIGAVFSAAVTGAVYGLLAASGGIEFSGGQLLWKSAGSLLTGGLVAPLVFRVLTGMDRMLGNVILEEDHGLA
jgi:rod shape-determining protein MreD